MPFVFSVITELYEKVYYNRPRCNEIRCADYMWILLDAFSEIMCTRYIYAHIITTDIDYIAYSICLHLNMPWYCYWCCYTCCGLVRRRQLFWASTWYVATNTHIHIGVFRDPSPDTKIHRLSSYPDVHVDTSHDSPCVFHGIWNRFI